MCYAAAFSFALRLATTNYIDDRGVKTDTELVEQAIAGDLMLSDAIETNVQDIDDYEKEYDRMEQENERLADHQRSVLCNIRDEVDALDTLLQDTRLNRRRMQGAVRIIRQMINREL